MVRGESDAVAGSAVRVWSARGYVVGAGFVAGADTVATCAHVVAEALGTDPYAAAAPDAPVRLDLPLLGDGADPPRVTGVVHRWLPIAPDGTGDVALLRVREPLPPGARMPPLRGSGGLWDRPYRALGFPDGAWDGVWSSGRVRAGQGTGWVQLRSDPGEQAVVGGFSGSAVWDRAARNELAPNGVGRWFGSGFSFIRRSAAPLIVLAAVAAAADAIDLLNWTAIEPTGDGSWFGSSGLGIGGARGTLTGDGDWATQLYALFALVVRAITYSAALVVAVRLASGDAASVLVGLLVAARRLLPLLGWSVVSAGIFMVGLLFFVLPGVFVLIATVPLVAVVTLEERGIRRCFELVRGRFWPTAARFVLMTTISQAWWLVAYALSFQIVDEPVASILLYTVLGAPGFVFVSGFFAATCVELKFHDDRRKSSFQNDLGVSPVD